MTDEARNFHSWQANRLALSGVDCILAATLPALSEALGLAQAIAVTGKSYMISFVARPEGTLLDGTPLKEAITIIDAEVNPKPFAYMVNCTHASNFKKAYMHDVNSSSRVQKRIVGLLANTSALKPEDLDNSDALVEEEPSAFGESVASFHGELGLKILGGCCGTDERHIGNLAKRLAGGIVESNKKHP